MAPVRNTRDILLVRFIKANHGSRETEDIIVEPDKDYVIAPDGEIVKVKNGGYEYTGMYVVE